MRSRWCCSPLTSSAARAMAARAAARCPSRGGPSPGAGPRHRSPLALTTSTIERCVGAKVEEDAVVTELQVGVDQRHAALELAVQRDGGVDRQRRACPRRPWRRSRRCTRPNLRTRPAGLAAGVRSEPAGRARVPTAPADGQAWQGSRRRRRAARRTLASTSLRRPQQDDRTYAIPGSARADGRGRPARGRSATAQLGVERRRRSGRSAAQRAHAVHARRARS